MIFPDEQNLRSIADALWNGKLHGRACIMVGAGVSRNAAPVGPKIGASTSFPSWNELTERMVNELYTSPDEDEDRRRAIAMSSAVSSALRIADEYEAARGRGRLDELLRAVIPDENYEPGKLHDLLCSLPWSDILTTNFDTLLERSAKRQIDRRYTIVRSQQDIPAAVRPRIVKLHGSFPDSKPFIITEDDFRTYEKSNPAMVNLVQQCFAENTCVLLGFSGDDPNFLRWTGWVRDVLGPSHMEPVYLVGILNHTPARRALLERRHVRSIDLSPIFPSSNWPEIDIRHKAATEWFLRSLEHLRPPYLRHWPSSSQYSGTKSSFEGMPDLPSRKEAGLRQEKPMPSWVKLPEEEVSQIDLEAYNKLTPDERLEASQRKLKEAEALENGAALRARIEFIMADWRHNRKLFPGWLVLPFSNREALKEATKYWIGPIIEAASAVEPQIALPWFEELSWRMERCLIPWQEELIAIVVKAFDKFDILELKDGSEFKMQVASVAAQLLRSYRETGKVRDFDAWHLKIEPLTSSYPEMSAFCTHQRALFLLETWRIAEVTELLRNWDVRGIDPIWRARKAAFLGEIGDATAQSEAMKALAELQAIGGPEDVAPRSREASVVWLANIFVSWQSDHRQIHEARRHQLRTLSFDPAAFEDRLHSAIASPPQSLLVHPKEGKNQKTTPVEMALVARRYIEDTGSLIRMPGLIAAGSIVSDAVPWLAFDNPNSALLLSVRNRDSGSNAELLNQSRLAQSSIEVVDLIFKGVIATLDWLSTRLADSSQLSQYPEYLDGNRRVSEAAIANYLANSALSHLRGLSSALTEEQLITSVRTCLRLRKNWEKGQWQTWHSIEETCDFLLSCCAANSIAELLEEILDQPIVGLDTEGSSPIFKHDMLTFPAIRSNAAVPLTPSLKAVVNQLFKKLERTENIGTKSRIILRLSVALHWQLLNEKQIKKMTTSVGKLATDAAKIKEKNSIDYLLDGRDLLLLPEIEPGKIGSRFISMIANTAWEPQTTRGSDGVVKSVRIGVGRNDPIIIATDVVDEPWLERNFRLSADEWDEPSVVRVLDKAAEWLNEEGDYLSDRYRNSSHPEGGYVQRHRAIVDFCRKIVLPSSRLTKKTIFNATRLLSRLEESGVSIISAGALFVKSNALSIEDISQKMREASASLEPSQSYAFQTGLLAWISCACDDQLPDPPEDLVLEVASNIRGRRAPDLWWAMQVADILLKRYPQCTNAQFRRDIAVGLRYLIAETDVTAPKLDSNQQAGGLERIRETAVNLTATTAKFPEGEGLKDLWQPKKAKETIRVVLRAFKGLEQLA